MGETEASAVTFDEAKALPIGTVFVDRFDEGVRFIIMRGPCSLCAYIGVPSDHPLAGHPYDNVRIDCHGGLTFSDKFTDKFPGWYFYGWDYGHCGDKPFYERSYEGSDKAWSVDDVDKDSWSAIYDFKRLIRLSEDIARKRGAPSHD